jgi:hypothetical protein
VVVPGSRRAISVLAAQLVSANEDDLPAIFNRIRDAQRGKCCQEDQVAARRAHP